MVGYKSMHEIEILSTKISLNFEKWFWLWKISRESKRFMSLKMFVYGVVYLTGAKTHWNKLTVNLFNIYTQPLNLQNIHFKSNK